MNRFSRLLVAAVAAIAVAGISTPATAAPVVTKTYRTYHSYQYTIAVDTAVTVTGGPRANQDAPLAGGGCKNVYRRMANGRNVYLHTTCPTPGTVRFTSPDFPPCETPFTITVDGAQVYTDLLNAPCPPPPPPAITIVVTDATATFTNPATIVQTTTTGFTVPALDSVLTADGPFSYSVALRYAGIGINRYVYAWATVTVPLDPGQTTTVLRP